MRILIISGGRISTDFAEELMKIRSFERVIAADAGLEVCRRLGIAPTDILGDFDSLKDRNLLRIYADRGIPVRKYPSRKDMTDTELAVSYAADLWEESGGVKQGEEKEDSGIWILGATGSRLDHTLANIGILAPLAEKGIPCRILDDHNELEMLKGPCERTYSRRPGTEFFSLLAFGGHANGIDLEGFSYPLAGADLSPQVSLGISNEIIAETGKLSLKEGYLLVVRARD